MGPISNLKLRVLSKRYLGWYAALTNAIPEKVLSLADIYSFWAQVNKPSTKSNQEALKAHASKHRYHSLGDANSDSGYYRHRTRLQTSVYLTTSNSFWNMQ